MSSKELSSQTDTNPMLPPASNYYAPVKLHMMLVEVGFQVFSWNKNDRTLVLKNVIDCLSSTLGNVPAYKERENERE